MLLVQGFLKWHRMHPMYSEEVPEDVRQNWHTALESFLKEYQTYPVDENFEVNPSLLSALPCYWPLVRMTLNAKAAINRFRVSLRRMYYNEKLQGASDENALRTVHNRANELELMALTPLAHYLANLFDTPNELPYVTSAKEWERLSSEEFWIHALLSESCRFNRELSKAADTKDDTKYQSRGVVNMQAITDVVNPALTTLPLQQIHIYFPAGFLDVVLPKLTSPPYMMNMREQPAGSPILATENHYITPHTFFFLLIML